MVQKSTPHSFKIVIMETLEEIINRNNLPLEYVSNWTNIGRPLLNKYKLGRTPVKFEDMLMLERFFKCRIKWNEPVKKEVIQDINILLENYPLRTVASFLGRWTLQPDEVLQKGLGSFTKQILPNDYSMKLNIKNHE